MAYADQRLDDGCWWNFGQGASGDHSVGNPANAQLANGGLSVLLFATREPTAVRFENGVITGKPSLLRVNLMSQTTRLCS